MFPRLALAAALCTMATGQMLYDFSSEGAVDEWISINDVVMGGISTGGLERTPEGTAVFSGNVSLERNGGFASVRSRPREWDLGSYSGLELRVRGDGQRYKLNLKTDTYFDGLLYRVAFATRADEWQTVRVPFSEFQPSFRGRVVPDAPPLDTSRIASVGLMISDKQAGPFRLEIASISAYQD